MDKALREEIVQKTSTLVWAPTCSREARVAVESWLNAVGTANEAVQTRAFIQELEEDIMPIDNLIAFARSEKGQAYFGADAAAGIAEHAEEIKAAGARYCDCPACAAAEAILVHRDALLAE